MFFRDRKNPDLLRGQPEWEASRKMLYQKDTETLEETERHSMDHHGSPSRIVRRDVRELETLRQVIVNLDGSELPFAPNHVFDHEINLRPIERGLPSFLGKGYS